MQEVAELAKECAVADDGEVLTESKASARLGRRVEGLISQVNRAIDAINIDDIPVEERLIQWLLYTYSRIAQANTYNIGWGLTVFP